jgi:hypothetical protein
MIRDQEKARDAFAASARRTFGRRETTAMHEILELDDEAEPGDRAASSARSSRCIASSGR